MLLTPEKLTVKPHDCGAFVYWNSVPDADGYMLFYYSEDDTESYFGLSYTEDTSRTISGFSNGKRYYVRVCAVSFDNGKEIRSDLSDYVSFVPGSLSSGKRKVMLHGSNVVKKIFEKRSDTEIFDTAQIISPLSLLSEKYPGSDSIGEMPKASLDIDKSFDSYLSANNCEYIAIDFYTAAALSMYRLDNSYYTASASFEKSAFFRNHKSDFEKVSPPFDDDIIRACMEKYADMITSHFDKDKIILVRVKLSDKYVLDKQLRNGKSRNAVNRRIKELEDIFIRLADPVVIDISDRYIMDGSEDSVCAYEPHFYKHTDRILSEIFSSTTKTCFDEKAHDIYIDRVIRYYENMTARACHRWIMDDSTACGKLLRYTSSAFIGKNKEFFVKLSALPYAELSDVKTIFKDDKTAVDIVKAADAVDSILGDDFSLSQQHYSIVFENNFTIKSLLAKKLTESTGRYVSESTAEAVLLLYNDSEKLESYFEMNPVAKVDIWGSCVSRESVKPEDGFICVNKYIFKQPPVLAFENAINYNIPLSADSFSGSAWRRRTIKEAFLREGIDTLSNSDSSWLIVDFYNLISRMCVFSNGMFETDDSIQRTKFFEDIKDKCRLTYLFDEKSDEFCEQQMKRFAEFVISRYGKNIILIKLRPNDRYITLDGKLLPLQTDDRYQEKLCFIRKFEELFTQLTDCYVIDLTKYYYSDDKFPLGGAHIAHFEAQFYKDCCKSITEIIRGNKNRYYSSPDKQYLMLRDIKLGCRKGRE